MVDEQPIEVDIDRALLLGQTFFLIDAFVAWCITGGLVVQFISYTAALKTTLSRERRWQIWSINILLFLTVSQTLVNVWRLINLEVVHYGNQDFADHYRGRPTGAIVFYLQLIIIVAVQLLVRERTIRLRKSIWIGKPNWIQNGFTTTASIVQPLVIAAGVASYVLVSKFPRYSSIVQRVEQSGMPWFLICQIIFNLGCLTLSTIKTFAVTYDIAEAKRSTTTSHPSAVRTYQILRDLWQVSLQNAMIVMLTHVLLLVALFYTRSSVAGRPCTTLNSVYVHSLLSQILQPQYTRKRQIMEDGDGVDYLPSHSAKSTRKQLFGLRLKRRSLRGKNNTPSPSTATQSSPSSLTSAVGFFTLLRIGSRRRSLAGLPQVGVHKVIEVSSYVNRPEDFGVSLHGRIDEGVEEVDEIGQSNGSPTFLVPSEFGADSPRSEQEDWQTARERVGYGNACWVAAGPSSSSRALTPQAHDRLALPSAAPRRSRSPGFNPTSSTKSEKSLIRSSFVRRAAPRPAGMAGRYESGEHHRRRNSSSGPITRADEMEFIQSFPTGAVTSTAYEKYDPDLLDSLHLPAFAITPDSSSPTSPSSSPSLDPPPGSSTNLLPSPISPSETVH